MERRLARKTVMMNADKLKSLEDARSNE